MTQKTQQKGFIIAVPLILLTACVGNSPYRTGMKPTAKPQATPNTYAFDELPEFYQANPQATPASPKTSEPLYYLVDWSTLNAIQTSYLNQGYYLLGHESFVSGMGVPERNAAIEYGKSLGADLVIYSGEQTPDGRTAHYIAFFAKSSS
jgi:hypothetical protein